MKQILIAGCGYMGQMMAAKLVSNGLNVLGLVRTQSTADTCQAEQIQALRLDLDEASPKWPATLELQDYRLIYLLPPPPRGQLDTRIEKFLSLIEGQSPEKFVLLSTTGVYGDCQGAWVDEKTEAKPVIDRARRRLDAEQAMRAFCEQQKIPWVILRVPGIYGPGKLPLARIQKLEPIVRQQDSPFSNRIHAEDLANIGVDAMLRDQLTGIYNCSDGQPSTMYDYFMRVAEAAGLQAPPAISLQQAQAQLSKGMLSYMSESRRIDNKKLLRDFDMQLKYPDLQSGLASIFTE